MRHPPLRPPTHQSRHPVSGRRITSPTSVQVECRLSNPTSRVRPTLDGLRIRRKPPKLPNYPSLPKSTSSTIALPLPSFTPLWPPPRRRPSPSGSRTRPRPQTRSTRLPRRRVRRNVPRPNRRRALMFAQINSEHCRHEIFNVSWTLDAAPQPSTLFLDPQYPQSQSQGHDLRLFQQCCLL